MKPFQPRGTVASCRRVRLIAGQTLAEALRLRLTLLLALAGAALVAAARWLQAFNLGATELKFAADFGLAAVGLVDAGLAVLVTAHLFFAEINGGGIQCLLTRPVRRWEYVAGKFSGVAALLALVTAALAGLLAGLLLWRGAQLGAPVPDLSAFLCAGGLVWLKATLVAAMTLLVCSYAGSPLFASCAGLLLAGAGQLRPFATADGWGAWLRLWPNLGLFDAEAVLAGTVPCTGTWLLGAGGYWAGYVLLFGGLASYAFQHREF